MPHTWRLRQSPPRKGARLSKLLTALILGLFFTLSSNLVLAQTREPASQEQLERRWSGEASKLLKKYCNDCHSTASPEGELDLERFASLADLKKSPQVWSKVVEMIDQGEMPPKDAPAQPSDQEKKQLRSFVDDFLHAEALANAGDPGPVPLRRLSNAEYTYTIRDLTGVPLSPAREFPADGAAGEGFTNAGAALVMSPALLDKYLAAGKEVAAHAVLTPSGIRFSPSRNHQDHVIEILERIRALYRRHSDNVGATKVNLQGVIFDTNDGGRLAVDRYLRATIIHRERLAQGDAAIQEVAKETGLNAKYLGILYRSLADENASRLLAGIGAKWRGASEADAAALAAEIDAWRAALWKFSSVGHIGKVGGPQAWQEAVTPLVAAHDLRLGFDPNQNAEETRFYLAVSDAGANGKGAQVLLEEPRFVSPGKPDLLLRDLRAICNQRLALRTRLLAQAEKCLAAASEAIENSDASVADLAKKYGVDADVAAAWFSYLGIGDARKSEITSYLTGKQERVAGYEFVTGWGSSETPNVLANSSGQHVRIPGNARPHSIIVHPSPTLNISTALRTPEAGTATISALVHHAHPECGNGVVWSLEVRRGAVRRVLSTGVAHGDRPFQLGPFASIPLAKGDLVVLVIGPRDGNHSCDATQIDLEVAIGERTWSLSKDVSPNILAGNPHADRYGNEKVWSFFTEPVGASTGYVIPEGSLLAQWQSADSQEKRAAIAKELASLLAASQPPAADVPDGKLFRQLTSLGGPLLSALPLSAATGSDAASTASGDLWGVDPARFGVAPDGSKVAKNGLILTAPALLEVRVPTDLVAGRQFVARAQLYGDAEGQASAQVRASFEKPAAGGVTTPGEAKEINADESWSTRSRHVVHSAPILVSPGGPAEKQWRKALDDFRAIFPQALCYTKIVPVDEVVTLTLYYREDDVLQRLMLSDAEIVELDRLWEELNFVSKAPLIQVDALEQLIEYATQDADPKIFLPLREPTRQRAEAFQQSLVEAEPRQLDALLAFAGQAYRRPLQPKEAEALRSLYQTLRQEELPHDEAIRFLIARVLTSPSFLYKLEAAPAGESSAPISNLELASRLSYFLWSSAPDAELRSVAEAGQLTQDDVLRAQTRRMIQDPKVRRLAVEFACQWLQIYEFDAHDEKSERHFPEFADLRRDMYEEAIYFFTDLFQNDRSILDILDAKHAFANERLAEFYAAPGEKPSGDAWVRIDNAREIGRGGVLAMAATLSKQSGASRTSPILRGNWVSEVLLGERLPRPPKDVPQLPDEEPEGGLTVRQLIERHSSDPRCATCHQRIDPFGFALERYDAIGRYREVDSSKNPIDVKTNAPDGAPMEGLDGLRNYLLTQRRDAFVKQFCRKLLGYALGRGVQLSDELLLAEMMASLEKNDYRFTAALEPIILSKQFREIRGRDYPVTEEH